MSNNNTPAQPNLWQAHNRFHKLLQDFVMQAQVIVGELDGAVTKLDELDRLRDNLLSVADNADELHDLVHRFLASVHFK